MGFAVDTAVMVEAACCSDLTSIQFFHNLTKGKYKKKTSLCGFPATEGLLENVKFLRKTGYAMGIRELYQALECGTYNATLIGSLGFFFIKKTQKSGEFLDMVKGQKQNFTVKQQTK